MKNLICLLLLVFLGQSAFAQFKITEDFDYELGRAYKVVDAPQKHYFEKNGLMTSVKINKKHIVVQQFNTETLRELSHKEYETLPKSVALEDVLMINNEIYIFYREQNTKAKTELLNYITIDFKTGKIDAKAKTLLESERLLGTLTGEFWLNTKARNSIRKFNFRFSEDSSRILVHYRLKPLKKRDAINFDDIGFYVFDKNLQPIWNEMLPMPYTEKNMTILDYYTDEKGVGYILAKVSDDPNKGIKARVKKGEAPKYHIELFRIEDGSTKFEVTKIDIDDKFIHSISLEESGGELLCGGFYNKGQSYSSVDGIFYFNLGEKGYIEQVKTFEIPAEILSQYLSKRAKKKVDKKEDKDEAELSRLVMRNIIPYEDGSLLLTGEQFFIVERTTTNSNGRTTTSYSYHYHDILAAKIAPDGSLAWMKKMPKRQVGGAGRGGMSYTLVNDLGQDCTYFLFLDNIENMELAEDESPKFHRDGKGGFFTGYRIDNKTGEMTKTSIFDTRNVKGINVYQYNTGRIVGLYSGAFLLEFYKKQKEDVLIKVFLKE